MSAPQEPCSGEFVAAFEELTRLWAQMRVPPKPKAVRPKNHLRLVWQAPDPEPEPRK
jgi:hypothetical protein